ncbi:uncharacterized protein LOC125588280 [Brassica napus]|uniref:uncharacterized protein LOC125588280 n=1 Tax=Brassica napus TaxID=3708 RepID=UPI00207A9706|nr:uncharacterized protein LOC125588280 [Brassica napus]
MSAILKAILQLWFFQPFVFITAPFRAVFPQFILVVGQFPTVPTTKCVISIVESLNHYDVTVKVEFFPFWSPIYVYGVLHSYVHKISHHILYSYYFDINLVIMADNLRRAIQDLTLGVEDEPVPLSATVCNEARRVNQFSLVGRPTIQRKQNIRALMTSLPRMWGLSGIISGRLVERRKFQFVFPSEELLQSVLNRGPWAFNDRMVVIKRWMPAMDDNDLMQIPFWVQIRGIPMEYLTEGVIRNIGDIMGEVMLVDFNPEANASVEYVRVQLNWNLAQPLRFHKNFQFSPGVNTLLKFRYERLRGFCETCGMIIHDSGECVPNGEDLQDDSEPDDEDNEGGGMDEGGAEPVLDGNDNMEHDINVADHSPPGGGGGGLSSTR